MKFEREFRYVVLKSKDIECLSDADKAALAHICHRIDVIRTERNASHMECVVIEHDWPEYDLAWAAIKYRMETTK